MLSSFTEANIHNLTFLDTMIWIDCTKDHLKQEALQKWSIRRNNEILIHSNLALELFNPRFAEDFNMLWQLIENLAWSNFSPIDLMHEEITYVILGKPVIDLLENNIFHYGETEKTFYRNDYFTNSSLFYKNKDKKIASENFIKLSARFLDKEQANFPMIKFLRKMEALMKSETTYDYSFFDQNILQFLKKEARSESVKSSTIEIISSLKNSSDRDFYEMQLNKLKFMKACGVNIDEHFTIGKFQILDYLLEKTLKAYQNGAMSELSWQEIAEKTVQHNLTDFPGLDLLCKVSNEIRSSNAKVKPSDGIDYLNLMYLPYVEKYVTDAHIASVIQQCAPQYAHKVVTASDFYKELANVT